MSPSDDGEQVTTSGSHDDSRRQSSRASRDGYTAGGDQHFYFGGKPEKKREPPKRREPTAPRDPGRRRRYRWVMVGGGVVALLVVGGVLYFVPGGGNPSPPVTTVQMAGSSTFFSDPNVVSALKRQGLAVQSTSLGSRQICAEPGVVAAYDVANSGSEEAATCSERLVQKAGKTPDAATPYDELMAIVTYRPIVGVLKRLHIASEVNGITVFDVAKYLKVFASGERWTDIPGNTTYPSHSRILLWATDPKESNSGGMLADIAYAAQTGGDPPTSIGPHDPRVPVIRSLFTELGSVENHTPVLLNQFLTGGMGVYPMAMVYESDYLSAVLSGEAQDPDLTVMYPTPDILSHETLVAWTSAGRRLLGALQSSAMAAPEEAHGYRTEADKTAFVKYMADRGITVPDLDELEQTLQFSNLPTEDVLQSLIDASATSQPG